MTAAAPNQPPGRGRPDGGAQVSSNALLLSMATVGARLSAFALAVVMGRRLGPAGYGVYGYASAIGIVLIPLADLGLTPYLTREVARDRGMGEALMARVVRIRMATSVGLVGLVGLAALASAAPSETVVVIVLVVGAALVDGLSLVLFGYFVGRERMALEAALTAGTALLRALGGIVLVLVTHKLLPAAAWILAVGVAQLSWASARARAARGQLTPDRVPIRWRTVLSLGATAIAVMSYLRADTVLVGVLLSERDVGRYAAAYTLMLGLQIVPDMVGRALSPVFARSWAGGHRDDFVRSWQTGMRAVLLICLPLSLAVSVLAVPIIQRFFGDGFGPGGHALAILVWSSPFAASNNVAFGALRGAGRDRLLTKISIAAALGTIALDIWAISAFGIEGAAVVTLCTEAVVFVAQSAPAMVSGLLPFPRLPYVRLGACLALLALVAMVFRGGAVELALGASLLAYVVGLTATGVLTSVDLGAAQAEIRRRRR